MSVTRRIVEATVKSVATGVAVGFKGVAIVTSVARAPARVVASLGGALTALDSIDAGVAAMHGEFVGMRADILTLDNRVEALRQEIVSFRAEIGPGVAEVIPMRGSVDALDGRLEALAHQLESVDALALRLGRFARTRARAPGPTVHAGNGTSAASRVVEDGSPEDSRLG